MPLRRSLIVSTTVLSFVFVGLAEAEEKKLTAAPLKGEIRLTPAQYRAVHLPVPIEYEQIRLKCESLKNINAVYEISIKWMIEAAKACANKAYTVQDQQAAGCIANEPLNQCMDKLYKYCRENWPCEGFLWTKPVLKGAPEKAAAWARALSQMPNQYANEAEQNAKALSP